jgi:hypothetical protein
MVRQAKLAEVLDADQRRRIAIDRWGGGRLLHI